MGTIIQQSPRACFFPAIGGLLLLIFCLLALMVGSVPARAASVYNNRPEDPRAVYFTREQFNAKADGVDDDADALQQAVNRAQETRSGVVFVPEGRYRLGKTVYVWQGVRLIGYGANRPVFVLGKDTPGFQEPATGPWGVGRYMIHFADNRPNGNAPLVDASEFTFYSGMHNIDMEIQDGNPAAVAVRFKVAQHSALTNMDIRVGSGMAAVEDIGNQCYNLHITGGKYGILTKKTSPAWQFLLMDSTFEGQSAAAIRTQEVGFTMIRVQFHHLPVAVEIPQGEIEELYGRDLFLEDVRDAALKVGDARNIRSQITLENTACTDVPQFVKGGTESLAAAGKSYMVDHFSLGLEIGDDGRERGIAMQHREHALQQIPQPVATDIPALPSMDKWINVHTLGAKGDNQADDTAALQAAVESHQVLFFPAGNYRITTPLLLKPDTVLIGFSPSTTTIALVAGGPAPAGDTYTGVIVAPQNGTNIVVGMAVNPGSPRAAGIHWMAGPKSLLEDVQFAARGGGGRGGPRGGAPAAPAPGGETAPDLLVNNNGGGIFRNLWLHATNSGGGLLVQNTSTPSKIYQLSNEHHPRVEVQFHNVKNWEIYDLQTEEENPAGANAFALDIQDSENLLFVNTFMYRVSRNVLPKPYAIITRNSDNIIFDNVHVFSQTRLAFDFTLMDESTSVLVREHEFTHFVVKKGARAPTPLPLPPVFVSGTKLEKVGSGFSNIAGLTADDAGTVYFTDAAMHKVYRWNVAEKKGDLLAELPQNQQPMVVGFVKPSTLVAIAYERAAYAISTKEPGPPQPITETADPTPGTSLLLPVGLHNTLAQMNDLMEHRGYQFRQSSNTAIIRVIEDEHRGYFYAPGSKVAIIAGGTWRPNLQTSQLQIFAPGEEHLLTSEEDARTYRAKIDDKFKFTATPFIDRGGNAVVTDAAGNIYLATAQVYIYNKSGQQIGVLEVPERPTSLAFGGPDGKTLYIGARGSLYTIQTVAAGK